MRSETPDSLPSTTPEKSSSSPPKKNKNSKRVKNSDSMFEELLELYDDLQKQMCSISADVLELKYDIIGLKNKRKAKTNDQPKKRIRSDRFEEQILKQLELPKTALENDIIKQFIQYNVAEKGKWIPFDDAGLKRFQMVMRVNSNDFDIARDGQGRPIMDQEMKKPLVVVKERISYAGLIDANNKNGVEDAIKTNMKMPACIYSTDPNRSRAWLRDLLAVFSAPVGQNCGESCCPDTVRAHSPSCGFLAGGGGGGR
jgi:hypothetical protein